jgi:hypothetical protein
MVTEMEKRECLNTVNELLGVLDRHGFDGFKMIVDIYHRDFSPREQKTILPVNEKFSFQVITGGLA